MANICDNVIHVTGPEQELMTLATVLNSKPVTSQDSFADSWITYFYELSSIAENFNWRTEIGAEWIEGKNVVYNEPITATDEHGSYEARLIMSYRSDPSPTLPLIVKISEKFPTLKFDYDAVGYGDGIAMEATIQEGEVDYIIEATIVDYYDGDDYDISFSYWSWNDGTISLGDGASGRYADHITVDQFYENVLYANEAILMEETPLEQLLKYEQLIKDGIINNSLTYNLLRNNTIYMDYKRNQIRSAGDEYAGLDNEWIDELI